MPESYELAAAFDAAADRWQALEAKDRNPPAVPGWYRYVLTTMHRSGQRVPLGKIEQMGDGPALDAFRDVLRQFTHRHRTSTERAA